jgi:transposase
MEPVHKELIRLAAQGRVLHNDDTPMKILSLMKSALKEDRKREKKSRNGVFTSGVLSVKGELKICLFFTGTEHAGEALDTVLEHRDESRPRPLQMCDALERNQPKKSKTVLGNCNSHGRRKFADIASSFPEQARHVIDLLAKVYHHDEIAEKKMMSERQRLAYHQEHSKPIMDDLYEWLNKQLDDKLVEPNCAAGKAIQYMINHWKKLTLFLRRPGAPLDNNPLERALKVPILHRKNSYFYKTENGARVGDIFMSIIHTCRLNHINASDYLNALQRHADQIARDPPAWMPWKYTKIVQALEKA